VLAARGLSNDRIAKEMNLAPGTVKRHLANVYEKMGVRSRSGAVRPALVEQWIGLTETTEAAPSPDGSDGDGTRAAERRLIQRSAWKGYSQKLNFRFTEF